jgi:hypothetical protein
MASIRATELSEVTGMMPGRTGFLEPKASTAHRYGVVLEGEEELGDGEVRHAELLGETAAVLGDARRARVAGRMPRPRRR